MLPAEESMIKDKEYCNLCCHSPDRLRQAVLKNIINYALGFSPDNLWLKGQETFKYEDSCPDHNCAYKIIDDPVFKEKFKDIFSGMTNNIG